MQTETYLFDVGLCNYLFIYFFGDTESISDEAKIHEWDDIKPESFCAVRETVDR